MEKLKLSAKCFKGFEKILAQELSDLGMSDIDIQTRAVNFSGNINEIIKANMALRTALSVVYNIDSFEIKNVEDFYNKALKIEWHKFIGINQTFRVETAVFSKIFNHSGFAGLKLKDAIVDRIRKEEGSRPDVNTDRPDIIVHLSIQENKVRIGFNTSGEGLFKRGYRQISAEAPINECIAAGMILNSQWDFKEQQLHNPMCGGGTLAIEAAMIALNFKPNVKRKQFAFEKLICFENAVKLKEENRLNFIEAQLNPSDFEKAIIYCTDIDSEMIYASKINASNLGLGKVINFRKKDFFKIKKATENAVVIINPPYDKRLEIQEPEEFYQEMGTALKHGFPKCKIHIISSFTDYNKHLALKPDEKIMTTNGGLDTIYASYTTFEGKRSDFKKEAFKNEVD